jgi:hypothetical protein
VFFGGQGMLVEHPFHQPPRGWQKRKRPEGFAVPASFASPPVLISVFCFPEFQHLT